MVGQYTIVDQELSVCTEQLDRAVQTSEPNHDMPIFDLVLSQIMEIQVRLLSSRPGCWLVVVGSWCWSTDYTDLANYLSLVRRLRRL